MIIKTKNTCNQRCKKNKKKQIAMTKGKQHENIKLSDEKNKRRAQKSR